jgi:hypothetical protein
MSSLFIYAYQRRTVHHLILLYYNLSLVFKFHYYDGPFPVYFEPNACRIEVID